MIPWFQRFYLKNLNLQNQVVEQNSNENSTTGHLEFNDVVVYQEMGDQTSIRLNLIEQIHAQMNQLDEMVGRKQFMIKEILHQEQAADVRLGFFNGAV